MNASTRHRLLLHTICDLLPQPQARRLESMDPTDYATFVEAYIASRSLPALTANLRRSLLAAIFDLMDSDTARFLQERGSTPGRSGPSTESRGHLFLVPAVPDLPPDDLGQAN